MQVVLPGPFVVMQGMPGDGIMNSIETMPIVDYLDNSNSMDTTREDEDGDNHGMNSPTREPRNLLRQSDTAEILSSMDLDMDTSRNCTSGDSSIQDRVECALDSSVSQTPNHLSNNTANDLDQLPYNYCTAVEMEAIQQWRKECQERAMCMDHDLFKSCNPQTASMGAGQDCNSNTSRHSWWASKEGRLLVFDSLPTFSDENLKLGSVVHELPPGARVHGVEMILLDSYQFNIVNRIQEISNDSWELSSFGLKGICIFLRITSPCEGFILLNLEGYYFACFGEPSDYTSPDCWIWKVSFAEGAFVRKGLELDSAHFFSIPFGGLVRVSRKTVNSMGLSRLGVEMINERLSESTLTTSEMGATRMATLLGWVSEFLNPLSGRRGPILQPCSFPVPVLYRVILPQGAIIRAGVELSSPEIGHAPFGSILSIVGRAFSEHPKHKCISRLKLGGDAGWISLRLNGRPPNDDIIVEMISIDSSFDPYYPEFYHLEKQRRLLSPRSRESDVSFNSDHRVLTCPPVRGASTDSAIGVQPYYYPLRSCVKCSVQNSSRSNKVVSEEKCLICLSDERTATLVHGETGHIACCLVCARILKARGDKCPVCRLPIDLVIQHFFA